MPPPASQTSTPAVRGPVYQLGKSRIRTGTCSWTDPTLVKDTGWYPKKSMTAAERLAFYARHFSLVEADSTYYRPPGEQLTRGWADRTPSGFRFNIKAYSLLTHHPTQPDGLWPDLREAIKPEFREKRNVYADHLESDALAEAWTHFSRPIASALSCSSIRRGLRPSGPTGRNWPGSATTCRTFHFASSSGLLGGWPRTTATGPSDSSAITA
jgi:hypothetical protein